MSRVRRWNRFRSAFFIGSLALAAVAVPWKLAVQGITWTEVLVALAMYLLVGTAVSGGYHRLFSHRAFQASAPVRFFFLCAAAAGFQNSALKWSSDHRLHHRHVDTEKDPYEIGKGFWYAHWLWVMEDAIIPVRGVADLERDPLVMWQHRHVLPIGIAVASIPLWIGLATGNFWGHLVIGGILRFVLTHHCTFLINSAAHRFGTRPYSEANSARDNHLLSPFTGGEGHHNFHHMWQWDYRIGARWWHWDATKWVIAAISWLGLASNLRRVPDSVIRRAQLAMEEKRLRERLALSSPGVAIPVVARLSSARARLDQALAALQERREAWETKKAEWKALRVSRADQWRATRIEWKAALAAHHEELKAAWLDWREARFEAKQVLAFA